VITPEERRQAETSNKAESKIMKTIQDFIRNHRQGFDEGEPRSGHEERFLAKLKLEDQVKRSAQYTTIGKWFKIAASVLIIASFGAAVYTIMLKPDQAVLAGKKATPEEIREIEYYYSNVSEEKLKTISEKTGSGPEAEQVRAMISEQVRELNKSTEELKTEYIEGKRDERVLNAIRNNYRVLNGLLDHVINQIDQPRQKIEESSQNNLNIRHYETRFC